MNKVSIDNLDSAVMEILNTFANATDEVCEKAVEATTKQVVNELHSVNVPGAGKYGSWDNYNKSWKSRKDKKNKYYHYQSTIYNEKYYRLTHLLEKGHAKVNGGRTKAFPHIAPIEEKAEEDLFRRIKEEI